MSNNNNNNNNKPSAPILYIGAKVLIRTVTHFHTGKVVALNEHFIQLADAAWIASTGRWAQALRTGTLDEVEPMPDGCLVGIGAVVDVVPWTHDLPREVK